MLAALCKSFSEDLSPSWSSSLVTNLIFWCLSWTELPELHTELEVRLHQHRVKRDNNFSFPGEDAVPEELQNTAALLAGRALLAHIQLTISPNSLFFFHETAPPTFMYTPGYPITGRKSTTCSCSISCSWWLLTSLILFISLCKASPSLMKFTAFTLLVTSAKYLTYFQFLCSDNL